MYAVRFIYPPAAGECADARRTGGARSRGSCEALRGRNVDYWFCGKRSIKPMAASDDGVHTRLTFGATGRAAGDLRSQ